MRTIYEDDKGKVDDFGDNCSCLQKMNSIQGVYISMLLMCLVILSLLVKDVRSGRISLSQSCQSGCYCLFLLVLDPTLHNTVK